MSVQGKGIRRLERGGVNVKCMSLKKNDEERRQKTLTNYRKRTVTVRLHYEPCPGTELSDWWNIFF